MQQAEEWISRLGMTGKIQQKAGTLSYGEKQRVAIIRALVQPFSWLLLDEPFSHLDNNNIRLAAGLIGEQVAIQKAGLIIVDLEDHAHFDVSRRLKL